MKYLCREGKNLLPSEDIEIKKADQDI